MRELIPAFLQVVLIEPRLQYDAGSASRGNLVVTVPDDNGGASFAVPIEPTKDVLASWPM